MKGIKRFKKRGNSERGGKKGMGKTKKEGKKGMRD